MAFETETLSPWLAIVEPVRYQATVSRIERLDPSVIVSAHTPVISGGKLADAFRHIRSLVEIPPPAAPDQSVLDAVLAGAHR